MRRKESVGFTFEKQTHAHNIVEIKSLFLGITKGIKNS